MCVVVTGCQWRQLRQDFPLWQDVHYHHLKWRRNGFWQMLNKFLAGETRQEIGKDEEPSAVIIASQSVTNTPENNPETTGYDGNKKVKGRKRHIIVDVNEFLLVVMVHPANENDGVAGITLI